MLHPQKNYCEIRPNLNESGVDIAMRPIDIATSNMIKLRQLSLLNKLTKKNLGDSAQRIQLG